MATSEINNALTVEEHFWSLVERRGSSDCWEWKSRRHKRGYGAFRYLGMRRSHIIAWFFTNGKKVPSGMCVCHSCDNPPCVNPDHLFLGSRLDNMTDMLKKRRHTFGEKSATAKLSERAVLDLLADVKSGKSTADVALKYGVARSTVNMISAGKRWRHLTVGFKEIATPKIRS